MAHTYKVSTYVVDPHDYYPGAEAIRDTLISAFTNCITHQEHITMSMPWEWDDDCPENFGNCDLADLDARFARRVDNPGDHFVIVPGQLYRHFKGHIVKVLAVADDTEQANTSYVIYEHMGNHRVWARPVEMFCSLVDKEKYPKVEQKYRFELVKNEGV